MTLLESVTEDNTSIIAMNKFILERAFVKSLCLEGNHSKTCEAAGINRPHMYERYDQLIATMGRVDLPGPGRPASQPVTDSSSPEPKGWQFCKQVLLYRIAHPSALVEHNNHSTYSDGFVRFILDLYDTCEGSLEWFCAEVALPCYTVRSWIKKDQVQPYQEHQPRQHAPFSGRESDEIIKIIEDYAIWEGSLRDFLKYEAGHLRLRKTPIYKVLQIYGLLPVRSRKKPRYRGSTEKCNPGDIVVTDGKIVTIVDTHTGEIWEFNWQGIIDQATTCHTAVVVTDTECAQGVREAFDASCEYIGHPPKALLHDNKPIHDEVELQEHIQKTTLMIPATPNRGENKAGIEGEFGKFEQTVGVIHVDNSNNYQLMKSIVRENLRTYIAGINHAGRVEFDGKSRESVLRETCPDPDKHRKFIENLHSDHKAKRRSDHLPTKPISRAILDEAFKRFGITDLDSKGETRDWLAGRFTPEAIRQGLAIFGTEREKGRLRNKFAHRYLAKVIMNCQDELDLRRQEELLREFAETERMAWLHSLEAEYAQLAAECLGSAPDKDLLFRLAESAAFGRLNLQRAFYEDKLKSQLEKEPRRFKAVSRHIQRLFETTWENRFSLISKLVNWEYQLAA